MTTTIAAIASERTSPTSDDWLEGETAANASFKIKRSNLLKRNYVVATEAAQVNSTATIPLDDTIPQIGEGAALTNLAATITPTTTTSRVRVRVFLPIVHVAVAQHVILALFLNGASDAVAAGILYANADTHQMVLEYDYVPGSTSAQAFTVRFGGQGNSTTINGQNSARKFGGVAIAKTEVQEIHV